MNTCINLQGKLFFNEWFCTNTCFETEANVGNGVLTCDDILQEIEKNTFHTLSEHRTWCPWIVNMRDSDGNTTPAGWRLLLGTLLPSLSSTATHLIHEVKLIWDGAGKSNLSEFFCIRIGVLTSPIQ